MPQLWTETFVSQYFWLVVILFTFNYFFVNHVVPSIAKNIKARKKTAALEGLETSEETATIIVSLPETTIKPVDSVVSFNESRKNWINSL